MLRNWLTRRVEFSYEGCPWPLVFTHGALLRCEELTGTPMLKARLAQPSARLLRALLFVALREAGAPCTLEKAGEQITRKSIASVRATIIGAWAASMADPSPAAKEEAASSDPEHEFGWMQAWAYARVELGLTDEEWLAMTPRQFAALQQARIVQMQREELLIGIVASTVQNFSMGASKKPASPQDFMLHKLPELPIGEQIMQQMRKLRR